MISYYKIYYDQKLTVFENLNYIFINKSLTSFEMSQQALCSFINDNSDNISFTCKLNENIYGIVRYIPSDLECEIPVMKELIYDVFMFPTPIKNKIPSYIDSVSIKTLYPMALTLRGSELDSTLLESLQNIYYDYSYENDEIEPTVDQTSLYIMMRVLVDYDNLFNSTDFTTIGLSQSDCIFSRNNIDISTQYTKYDVLKNIIDSTSGYYVIVCNETIIIIDCSNKTYAYLLIIFNGFLINSKRVLFNDVQYRINNTIRSDALYFTGIYYFETNSIVSSIINKINLSTEKNPLGNLYMISTFDDSLIDSAINLMIS